MAGMTPADVDVAEVHDFFTGIELISYEDLGFAERFGAYKLVEAEVRQVGGATAGEPQRRAEGQGAIRQGRRASRSALSFSRNFEERRPTRWMARELRWRTTSADRRRYRLSRSWKDRPMRVAINGPERWSRGCLQIRNFFGPMQAVGGLFAMSADAVRCIFRRPFQWREFLEQCWFIAQGLAGADAAGRHPVHGAGELHAQHLAARAGRGRLVRRGCGVRRGDPGRTRSCTGADRCRGRRDGDLRRSWGRARSAKRSTRWRCWGSIRCNGW